MSEPSSSENKRIFLALWPDELVRQQLFQVQKKLKPEPTLQPAKMVIPDNLHMTLHFIGSISPDVLQALVVSLDSVRCKPFELMVNTIGCFPKPRVVWLGLKNIPPELNELEQQTAACIENYQRIDYRPHITLFRKTKTSMEQADFSEINWSVKSFALVESKSHAEGVQYHVLKKWLLSK
ncbi:MAG: RNA 2',3'-cyclic phosphodiesterase [Gammaproteobacteria bacterium]|nr:RNA 2',3'-cyclic phosphodiesterase [Gammaproteobacteria bacterium]